MEGAFDPLRVRQARLHEPARNLHEYSTPSERRSSSPGSMSTDSPGQARADARRTLAGAWPELRPPSPLRATIRCRSPIRSHRLPGQDPTLHRRRRPPQNWARVDLFANWTPTEASLSAKAQFGVWNVFNEDYRENLPVDQAIRSSSRSQSSSDICEVIRTCREFASRINSKQVDGNTRAHSPATLIYALARRPGSFACQGAEAVKSPAPSRLSCLSSTEPRHRKRAAG